MKVVIAPDSFKESLSAREVARAIGHGVQRVVSNAEVVTLPMADGGEGTLQAILDGTGGQLRSAWVVDALGRTREASWGWIEPTTALIEMASAAGLEHISANERDIMRSDTRGVGQLILHALDAGAESVVLTAGGSATNDAGAGMLQALGLRLLDQNGLELAPGPAELARLASIDASGLDPRLKSVRWTIATDVDNPLCGPRGASAVFGPQKGASAAQVEQLDAALKRFAQLSARHAGIDHSDSPGAGAAGGFGFAALAWLGAQLQPGAAMVAELVGLEQHIMRADVVFTGEGRMDAQTLHGKAPMQVIRTACKHQVPVVALAGSLGSGYESLYEHGLTAAFSLTSGPMSLDQACQEAGQLITQRTVDVMRLLKAGACAGQAGRPS